MKNVIGFGVVLFWIGLWVQADVPPQTFSAETFSGMPGNRQLVAVVDTSVQVEPPSITLNIYNPTIYNVYRKDLGASSWGSVLHVTSSEETSWADTNVVVGVIYEYRVSYNMENITNSSAVVPTAYLTAGIRVDRSAVYQGRVILCMDQTLTNSLVYEVARLKSDLAGDGWRVETLLVAPSETWDWEDGAAAQGVRESLYSLYTNAPANDKPVAIYLLGHIPVAMSGLTTPPPDGHAGGGAKPADSYYADLDGVWTDTGTWDFDGSKNYTNDYKWDQDLIPSDVEVAVGRVDLEGLAELGGNTKDLLRRYLDKAHNFRHAHSQAGMSVLHKDGNQITDEFAWRELIPICGLTNYQYATVGNIGSDGSANVTDYANKYGPFLFCENAGGVGPTDDEFATYGSQVVFWNGWQSFYWVWNKSGNLMRAGLGSEGLTLGYWSAGRCGWFMQHVAMGLPVSYSLKETLNNDRVEGPYSFQLTQIIQPQGARDSARQVWMNYMGDPTIRWFVTRPPSNLTAQLNGGDVELSWTASSQPDLEGYHVFRAASPEEPFTNRINSVVLTTTHFTDTTPPVGDTVYMVKAVALQQTGSGTFLNPSQGVIVPIYTNAPWIASMPEEGALTMISLMSEQADSQTLTVTNLGGGTLSNLLVSSNTDWLDATLDNTGPVTVTVQPNTAADSLTPGTYLGSISITADGATAHHVRVALDVVDRVEVEMSTNAVVVPEGSTNSFEITLSIQPVDPTTVTVLRAFGDTNIHVFGESVFLFTTNNWDMAQSVTLSASDDDDWVNGVSIINCIITDGVTNTLTATEVDDEVDPSLILPFSESFEERTLGTLNTQHGWVADAGATVQTGTVCVGSQALRLQDATASHTFIEAQDNVLIEFQAKFIRGVVTLAYTGTTVAIFSIDTNGYLVAYSNETPITISGTTLSDDWHSFKAQLDYTAQTWDMTVDDTLLVDDFAFYSAQSDFTKIAFKSGSEAAYLDEIYVANQTLDTDGDGIPDTWEDEHYNGITNAIATNLCANGINTILEAYITGLNPTNANSTFKLGGFGNVLQWSNVSDRVYTIYWTSNLLSGFGAPWKSNITSGVFTDTFHEAETEGFYKLEVEME